MNLLHRSAKRLLLTPSVAYLGLVEIPIQAFLHRLLQEKPVQKNIIEQCTRHFSAVVEYQIHETLLKDQQQQPTDVYWDLLLSQQQLIRTDVTEERERKGDFLISSTLQAAGGAIVLESATHAGDCVRMLVDDAVTTCTSASQKGDKKELNFAARAAKLAVHVNHKEENCCDEGISECIVADTETIPHESSKKINQFDNTTSEIKEVVFLSELKKENKHFVCSASELAAFDLCEASCKDTNKENDFGGSTQGCALKTVRTTKFSDKGEWVHLVDDSTSDSFICDLKSTFQNHNPNFVCREMLKVSSGNNKKAVQREDIRMPIVENSSEFCEKDAKTSSNNKRIEGLCTDCSGTLKGVGETDKVDSFRKKQVQVFQPQTRVDFAKKNMLKKRKKKNTNKHFRPEDLKHLNLTIHASFTAPSGQGLSEEKLKSTIHASRTAPSGQGLCEEKLKSHGTCLLELPSKSNPAADCQEVPEFLFFNNSRSRKEPELKDKERGESEDSIFADKREVKKGTRNKPVEDKHKFFICDNSCQSPFHQDQILGEFSQHMVSTEQSKGRDGEGLKNSRSPLKPHTYEKNEAGNYVLGNKGKMIDSREMMVGTFFDPPSNFWERGQTFAPERTIGSAIERTESDFAGVRKVHHPLRNQGELYIILDLNGVLIKRWDKKPSIPGVFKLNKKWVQVRPGCIEFLRTAFSSFRVGIWSTMTQKNALNTCKFLEQQAHESLPFFMLWSKESCYQHMGVKRPNNAKVVADFKPLSRVWDYFKPFLGFHNTILVDDSPYKACMNNPYNCIFPDAFEGEEGDTYLNDVLWPYLENLRRAHNMQAYIANNPLGQLPVVVGHELYYHVRQVMDVFDHRSCPLRAA